jgi:hypothetical protein
MERKPAAQELAQKALELLNETDKLEEEKNWVKAIENYQQAAEYLKNSGYLPHRIMDIYNRIEEIKNFIEQEKRFKKQTIQTQIDQLQNQAFALLDGAKKLETDGYFNDAIKQYMSAIKLLVEAGWTETQLENLKSKILILAQNAERQKLIQEEPKRANFEESAQIPSDSDSYITNKQIIEPKIDKKTEQLKKYETKRKKEEEIQKTSFELIDRAKLFEKEKRYDNAINNYQEATKLLDSIGWTSQTKNLKVLIEKLKKDKADFETIEVERQKQAIESLKSKPVQIQTEIESEEEVGKKKLREFEVQKQREEEIQTKAFNLIDFGKRLEREKKYNEAIIQFQKAIDLLKSISWDAYIQPIFNFINEIEEKKEREVKAEQIKKKRQEDLNQLQKTIYEKQKEKFVQTAQEFELRRRDFEQEKLVQSQKEKHFFKLLDDADKILQEEADYNKSISQYEKALGMLKDLGPGWESYYSTIQSTISNIKQRKDYQLEQELEILKKKEERNKNELEFQEQIDKFLKKQRKQLEQKEITLKAREEELEYREQAKIKAFQFLEAGQNYLEQGDFDKAIYSYQNAGNIFAEIQWSDEIPLIEKSIEEIERRKKESLLTRQKVLQEAIEREKEEREFQTEITTQLQIERENLKQKEIILRLRERELEYRENRKDEAYKILDEAQNYVINGEYDNAIETYHRVANIFAEIQWDNEISLIQQSIIEIENKKREAQIQKQKEFQAILESEREERLFQERMSKAMQEHIREMKEREVLIIEKEQELKYSEQKKEEAFNLLDKAQNLLLLKNFDEALEIYYEVANIFAQIQWQDEIPMIQNAIKNIQTKKEERELWKQKTMQKALEEQTSYLKFIDQLRTQRELEKVKSMENLEFIEKQKEISAQMAAKQEDIFKIIDEGDELLKQEKYDEAIIKFKDSIASLSEIGWDPGYLRLLQDNIEMIQNRKLEIEKEKEKERESIQKRQISEKEFQSKIAEEMQKEKERIMIKKIEILKREEMKAKIESKKSEAFDLMKEAESLLVNRQYELCLEKYRQAELILNEIQFPTQIIKETILKVEEKKRDEYIAKQKELENNLKKNQEDFLFKQKIAERIKLEQQKIQSKEIEIRKKEELKKYLEKRKEDAFKLLEDAETFLKKSLYDKSLEFYKSAELILNEIQYPTDVIKDMIHKVREKKNQRDILKQNEIEIKIKKEREDYEFQRKVADNFKKEKERLEAKELELEEKEKLKAILETKRQQGFEILDKAHNFTKNLDYDQAIEYYRKAELILNELHFPTDSIRDMITKTIKLKQDKEKLRELELERELQQLEEEKQLRILIEERRRQEEEKKVAQELALIEREKLIQDQKSQREAAYALLEEAGKYLKRQIPDYDKAISLYFQARRILSEKIGWEPEIKNLDSLIKDLQQEKTNLIQKQRYEAQLQLKRQQEFENFKEEMMRKKIDHDKQMEDQRLKLKNFEERKQLNEELRSEGLRLLDEGKRNAKLKDFDKAYQMFETAISHFKEIGWNEQIHYIETEIKNTKNLEERFKHEQSEREKLKDELEKQRQMELDRWKQEDLKMKATVGEVGNLADEVSILIRGREDKLKAIEQEKKEQLKIEAKEYSKNMGKMLRIKQELLSELEKAKKEEMRRKEEQQKAKDREEVDEIAKMLRDLKNKKK